MAIRVEHELHARRAGRNYGLLIVLGAMVALVFGLTIVKIVNLGDVDKFQGYDHVVQPLSAPADGGRGMNRQSRTALGAGGLVVVMAAASFAAVPFYDWFCRATGFAGTTGVAAENDHTPVDSWVTVRFVGAVDRGFGWEFKPVQTSMRVRLGETNLAFFEAHNPTDEPLGGQATFNVVPYEAGPYFEKIQCFCFTEQVLQPGETVQMPVSFYVDPAILDDQEGKLVHEITLGYTFYQADLPAAADGAPTAPVGPRAAASGEDHASLLPGPVPPLTVRPQAAID